MVNNALSPACAHQIIDARGSWLQMEGVVECVIMHAGDVGDIHPGFLQMLGKLRGTDKFAPVMRAPGHPLQNIFGSNDAEQKTFRGAVNGRKNKDATGLQQTCDAMQ